jgi:hypothetical protein
MRRNTLFLALGLAIVCFTMMHWWTENESAYRQLQSAPYSASDVSPVCPWRNPTQDLQALFPPARNYVLESRILSSMTVDIVKRLGRQMNTDENPLRIHRVLSDGRTAGSVLVTRVKGDHGGIEIVIGVNATGDVKGIRIQSQREPPDIASEITGSNFLAGFVGKTSSSVLRAGDDLPAVQSAARATASAIADGVRSQLIALSFAERLNDAHAKH